MIFHLKGILEEAESICYNASRQRTIQSIHWIRKNPQRSQLWGFFMPFLQGGLILRLATASHLCPTI